jgi:hypothetical protein
MALRDILHRYRTSVFNGTKRKSTSRRLSRRARLSKRRGWRVKLPRFDPRGRLACSDGVYRSDRRSRTGIPPLKPRSLLRRYLFETVIFVQSRKRFLISDWQRQCPRPRVQMKPVTQPADGGEGATPYCWSWRWDFLFLAPQWAHCIMSCSR